MALWAQGGISGRAVGRGVVDGVSDQIKLPASRLPIGSQAQSNSFAFCLHSHVDFSGLDPYLWRDFYGVQSQEGGEPPGGRE